MFRVTTVFFYASLQTFPKPKIALRIVLVDYVAHNVYLPILSVDTPATQGERVQNF